MCANKRRDRVDLKKEDKSGEVRRLKNTINKLKKENEKLKAQLKDTRKRLDQSTEYVGRKVKDIDLDTILSTNELDDIPNISCNICNSYELDRTTLPFGYMVKCKICSNLEIIKSVDDE